MLRTMTSWPSVPGLAFGADYNPEQWPEEVWQEDVRLMQEAGVNLVSLAIFSWALLEPEPDHFEFGWLDRVMDRLARAGIGVDLATATASPPPWLARHHPEILPVTADGRLLWPGSRQAWCPSSPVFRRRSVALVERMAERYRDHPALTMWHVSNELGCHNAHCYCDVSAASFRVWLRHRYGDLQALNEAWGTDFWSQHYSDWEEINPPRLTPSFSNPTQQLDFKRFSSDELLAQYRAERDVLRRVTPGVPVTTNFMAMWAFRNVDYWSWAPEVDIVSNDHYLRSDDPNAHVELAFAADLTRGLANGRPWLLMEHSPSAVNWQPRNVPKDPGQMRRNSIQHIARGADGALFFQWRASRAGAEKFHSAMVPHGGTATRVWREVVDLGTILRRISRVRGTRVTAETALVFDWQAWWASELDAHPTIDVVYLDRVHAFHRALWRRGVTVDVVPPGADLSRYRLVIVPTLYLVTAAAAEAVTRFVENGGTVLITYFSGIVDENDHVRLGGYPGAFRDLLGIRVEEFAPLRKEETARLEDGTVVEVWTERLELVDAEAVIRYSEGRLAGVPAVTRAQRGYGRAWYVATRLPEDATGRLIDRLLTETGISPAVRVPEGVEAVRRTGEGGSYLFLINHTDGEVSVPVRGVDLVTGATVERAIVVPSGGVAVVEEEAMP